MSYIDIIFVSSIALLSAFCGVYFVSRARPPAKEVEPTALQDEFSFLFKQDRLQHASPIGQHILGEKWETADWYTLQKTLSARFPDLPTTTDGLGHDMVSISASDPDDSAILKLSKIDDCVHAEVIGCDVHSPTETHRIKSLEAELATLRMASATAPHPIWTIDSTGDVAWHNAAYATLYRHVFEQEPHAKRPLFETFAMTRHISGHTRASLQKRHSGEMLWFDVMAEESGAHTVFHATDINAVIQAEVAQRNFVQTLAKTFAQLSTGLSIFDRNGQLALFNPALVDLTALPAEFLSARPDLLSFFDRLRDNRVMPEPKNYHSWRQEIADLIAAATDGRYQETWTLDSGQTYRVSGRPHPDGAIAFLIEDISAEISMTRNYRSELEMSQSLIDSLTDGLVVFSAAGVLQFCNAAYREMWKLDPESSFADVTIIDSIRDWQKQSNPDPTWGDIRDFVFKVGERAPWDSVIERSIDDRLVCSVSPITSGATLVRFEKVEDAVPLHPGKLSLIQD